MSICVSDREINNIYFFISDMFHLFFVIYLYSVKFLL